jgi:hypothetical protein
MSDFIRLIIVAICLLNKTGTSYGNQSRGTAHPVPNTHNDRGQACRPGPSNMKQTGESASPAPIG